MTAPAPRWHRLGALLFGAWSAVLTLKLSAWQKAKPESTKAAEIVDDGRHGPPPRPEAAGAGYETHDASARALLVTMGIFAAAIASAIGLMLVLLGLWHARDAEQEAAFTQIQRINTPPPEPRLQADPFNDLAHAHDREAAAIHGYARIDAKTARIPIERAMALMTDHPLDTPAQAAAPLDAGK